MTVTVGWGLAIALILLVALGVVAAHVGRLGAPDAQGRARPLAREQVVAALRAVVQLALIAGVVTWAVQTWWGGALFALVMFAIGVWTTTGRVGVRACWPWTALAMAAGVLPVLLIVFLAGAAPFNGITIVALGGIVTGNMMTAHTLAGRRTFAELRAQQGTYEAALALGFERAPAIGLVADRVLGEALVPNIDQTRTVGLVTLPGAFIGVLLGGGSPLQAGAAQVLVLIGIMAGQACTVAVFGALVRLARIVPGDLADALHQ